MISRLILITLWFISFLFMGTSDDTVRYIRNFLNPVNNVVLLQLSPLYWWDLNEALHIFSYPSKSIYFVLSPYFDNKKLKDFRLVFYCKCYNTHVYSLFSSVFMKLKSIWCFQKASVNECRFFLKIVVFIVCSISLCVYSGKSRSGEAKLLVKQFWKGCH